MLAKVAGEHVASATAVALGVTHFLWRFLINIYALYEMKRCMVISTDLSLGNASQGDQLQ